jgi:alpha-D-ribose 1-methylphosphonate 5-triphosphate synthase subunit PhnG
LKQTLNLGSTPDDGTGDSLRTGGGKINSNFDELYAALAALGTSSALNVDTDGTAGANSDTRVMSQKAVKTLVSAAVANLLELKGSQNCSGNPNYPAASAGDSYLVSVAGKIGGASGKSVDVGDMIVATADNAGGTEASVGTSWIVLEHNLVGALLTTNNLSDLTNAATARTNLGVGFEPLNTVSLASRLCTNRGVNFVSV